MFANLDGAGTLDDLSVLSLIENGYDDWAADFSTITDSKTNPASNASFDCEADGHLSYSFTYEVAAWVSIQFRRVSTNDNVRVHAEQTLGKLYLQTVTGGVPTTLWNEAVFSDGVPAQVDVTFEGSTIKVFVDNVLKTTQTSTKNQTTSGGQQLHILASNDLVITTHPYPALGIATDRIIAPQATDTFSCEANLLMAIRNIEWSSGNTVISCRYIDVNNQIQVIVAEDGACILRQWVLGANTDLISAGAASVSSGVDIVAVLDGVSGEVFAAGTSLGSTSSITHLTGTSGKHSGGGSDAAIDSIELWPRDVSSILPPELT